MSTSLASNRRKTISGLFVTLLIIALTMLAVASPMLLRWQRLRHAESAIRERDFQGALVWLNKAARLGKQHPQVQMLMARAYRHLDQLDEAAVHLRIAEDNRLPEHLVDLELKLALAQSGRLQEVQSYLGNMLINKGDRVEVYEAFVRGFLLQRRFQEAEGMLNDWYMEDPGDAWESIYRGNGYAGQFAWEQAATAYRQAIEKDETVAEAHYGLGQALVETKATKEAEEHFSRCIQLSKDHFGAHVALARCLLNDGDLPGARENLNAAADVSPDDDRVQFGFAAVAFAQKQYEEALVKLKPVLDTWPEDEESCLLSAKILEALGRHEEAQKMQATAESTAKKLAELPGRQKVAADRPTADVRYEVGLLLYNLRSRDEGVKWIEAALLIDSQHREARQTLIKYYDRIGKHKLATYHRQLLDVLPQ